MIEQDRGCNGQMREATGMEALRARWMLELTTAAREGGRVALRAHASVGDWDGAADVWLPVDRIAEWAAQLTEVVRATRESCTIEVSDADSGTRVLLLFAAPEGTDGLRWQVRVEHAPGIRDRPGSDWILLAEMQATREQIAGLAGAVATLGQAGACVRVPLDPMIGGLFARHLPTPMLCRRCEYDLQALTEMRCPECGQEFDPMDPRTYLDERPRKVRRALGRMVLIIFVTLTVFCMLAPLIRRVMLAILRY